MAIYMLSPEEEANEQRRQAQLNMPYRRLPDAQPEPKPDEKAARQAKAQRKRNRDYALIAARAGLKIEIVRDTYELGPQATRNTQLYALVRSAANSYGFVMPPPMAVAPTRTLAVEVAGDPEARALAAKAGVSVDDARRHLAGAALDDRKTAKLLAARGFEISLTPQRQP